MSAKNWNAVRLHIGLFFAEAICVSAFIVETSRALSGNVLSWAYVVEWPILAGYAIYMWRKLLQEEDSTDDSPPPPTLEDDPRLAAWNDYLARVHADDQSNQDES